ncbi:sensor histidine kinase [Herbiconiux ginsengi]|uniref:histidine kinase n=1 Tax=Herbiconiux ginsengi TaxID=381665 RepID=A0A1H3KVP5_9MICO|nr:ATP-binding protein [Herbiconiux ginsengi]SDY55734.1 two-component system, OmpR family, sensor histidine kinase TrcS [Herbiconiux ginsengi]
MTPVETGSGGRGAAGARSGRARRPWTLRSRLVVGVSAVVAGVLVAIGIASILILNATVTRVVDTQLTGSMSSFAFSVEKYRYGNFHSADGLKQIDAHPEKPFTEYTGSGPGSVVALIDDGTVVDSARFTDGDASALPPAVVEQLEAEGLATGTRETIALDGLGSYRIATETDSRGALLVTGVSMAAADASSAQQTVTMLVLALAAIIIIGFGVIVIVRLALRPLERVAATAADVAAMPLDRGEVAITTRVQQSDTDPRTEVGQVGEALNHLLAHVDDALAVRAATDKRMRRFVTDASHELRTPLAAIQGYAELTRQQSAELPEMTEYALARIESEAQRMNSLVSDLLLLARLDEGQDLHVDEVDLGEIVVNAVSDAKASAPGHRWTVDVPDAPALVHADRERMHQLVLNLLSNAAVHTPEGTAVSARVAFVPAGGAADSGAAAAPAASPSASSEVVVVELQVTDDGPGIASELVPELFERFARGDSSRSRRAGSTGLGLAIVASIVEAHAGSIDVASTPAGTTFTVRLARAAPSASAPSPTPARGSAAPGEAAVTPSEPTHV